MLFIWKRLRVSKLVIKTFTIKDKTRNEVVIIYKIILAAYLLRSGGILPISANAIISVRYFVQKVTYAHKYKYCDCPVKVLFMFQTLGDDSR